MGDLFKNQEGYADPTAGAAMREVIKESRKWRPLVYISYLAFRMASCLPDYLWTVGFQNHGTFLNFFFRWFLVLPAYLSLDSAKAKSRRKKTSAAKAAEANQHL